MEIMEPSQNSIFITYLFGERLDQSFRFIHREKLSYTDADEGSHVLQVLAVIIVMGVEYV